MNQPQRPKTSGLAIAALVLAFLCFPVGLVLGIIAYIQIKNSKGELGGQGIALAAMIVPATMVPMMGILAAIAIPNFIRYQLRSKQSEAKTVLAAIRTSQQTYFADHGAYVTTSPNPSAAPGTAKEPWDARPCPAECSPENAAACTELACIGYQASGPVYFRYACEASSEPKAVTCAAVGDLDGDGELSALVYGIAEEGSATIQAPVPAFAQSLCSGEIPANTVHDCTPRTF